MKKSIWFLLFTGLAGSKLAWASIDGELVEDKPDRLYAVGDMLSTISYSDNIDADNGGGVCQEQVWHQDYYLWQDGLGGNGWTYDKGQSDGWNSSGYLWGSTNITSAQMTWNGNGTGTEVVTANDGTTSSYDIGLPLLTGEHCDVNDPRSFPIILQNVGGGNWVTNFQQETYERHSQTRWRLQTGGRAGRQSLFQLKPIASQILDKRAQRPFYMVNSVAVPPQYISVMSRQLPSDGNLWVVLPDATNVDVTPIVQGVDFFQMNVSYQKYVPGITLNEVSLDAGTPEFCAGQYLQFNLVFDPPPESSAHASWWGLPGAPVNEHWQQSPSGSVNYRFNPNLLTNLSTCGWYLGSVAGTAVVGTSLVFSNGQFCWLPVQGKFSIATPSFSGFASPPSEVGFTWNPPSLEAEMQWQTSVEAGYDGYVAVTQLISGTNTYCNSGGAFYLDGTNELYGASQVYSATNSTTHFFTFLDSRSANADPSVTMVATCKDYLRFLPSGSQSNIWITVATNTWSMAGSASLSGGLIQSNLAPAGLLAESQDMPCWTNRFGH